MGIAAGAAVQVRRLHPSHTIHQIRVVVVHKIAREFDSRYSYFWRAVVWRGPTTAEVPFRNVKFLDMPPYQA